MFIKAWSKLYPLIDIKIIFINDNIPDSINEYKNNIILFKPIENISTVFISQYIRLLYPAILNYENGIMITDIDMIPMNNKYYTKNIENIDNNKFIYLRNVLVNDCNQIAMCYNVALNKTWSDIFNIKLLEDINEKLISIYKNGIEWTTDQSDLYNYVMDWNKITNNFVILDDLKTGYNRLCRDNIINTHTNIKISKYTMLNRNNININDNIKNMIKLNYYSDYHCCRPYNQYKLINDEIINLL
jgi:hypothetical protein